MTLDRLRGNANNKQELLKAVQKHLEKIVDVDFDGNLIISVRKGYMGKVRGVPRETQNVFDPRGEVQQKRLLTEKVGK